MKKTFEIEPVVMMKLVELSDEVDEDQLMTMLMLTTLMTLMMMAMMMTMVMLMMMETMNLPSVVCCCLPVTAVDGSATSDLTTKKTHLKIPP